MLAIAAVQPQEVKTTGGVGGEIGETVAGGEIVVGGIGTRLPGLAAIGGKRGGHRTAAEQAGAGGAPERDELLSGRHDLGVHAAMRRAGGRGAGIDAHR